jgi:hypothetical protein
LLTIRILKYLSLSGKVMFEETDLGRYRSQPSDTFPLEKLADELF